MKRSASLALIITMILSMICFPVGVSAEADFDIPSGAIAITSANAGSVITQNGTDKVYYLKENISISNYLATEFSGKLYGCGYTVTTSSPLFKSLSGATVCDVNIVSSISVGSKYILGEEIFLGSLANTAENVQISRVSTSGSIYVNSLSRRDNVTNISFGGLIGKMGSGSLTDCINSCVISYSEDVTGNLGGLVGTISATSGSFSAVGCINNAAVGNASTPISGVYVGGIVAYADAPSMSFTSCVNNGVLNGNSANAGGILGRSANASTTLQMTSCANTAAITTITDNTYSTSAGIIGHAQSGVTFSNCSNSGNITTSARTAGIAGWVAGTSTFTDCINTGRLESTNSTTYHGYVGGIAGYISGTSSKFDFEYCENYGELISRQTAGGIIGYVSATGGTTVKYSINKGNVTVTGGYVGTSNTASSAAGGIVGRSNKALTIKYCASIGDVANNSNDSSYISGKSAAGIVGNSTYAPVITDNFFIGKVSVKNSAYSSAISTVSSVSLSSVRNNYYLHSADSDYIAGSSVIPTSLTLRVTDAQVKSGKLAYLLQSASGESETVWGQDVSGNTRDAYPVLRGEKVYYDETANRYYNQRSLAYSSVNLTASFTLYAYVYSDINITDTYTAVFEMHGVKTVVKPTLYSADQDLYRFAFSKIAPQYIGENITITLYDGDRAVDTAEMGLTKYCEGLYAINNSNLKQLAADIVAYGKAARDYVIESGIASADEIAEINSPDLLAAASVNNTQKIIPSLSHTSNSIDKSLPILTSVFVQFNSTNRLAFTVKVPAGCDPADWKLVVDGKEYSLTSKNANGEYQILTDDIYAMNFMKEMAISLTNGTPNHTLTYSIAIYGSRMSKNGSTAAMRNLAAATYWYGMSSHNYINLPAVQYTLNGKDLSSFSIVASSVSNASAASIADYINKNYGISLPIVSASTFASGNAILIDQGNTYGRVRYGIDSDTADNGDVHIFIDGVGSYTDDMTDKFIELLPAAIDRKLNIEDDFYYNYPSNIRNNGYLLNTATDATRTLAEGVTYIERTYTTAKIKSGTATISPAGIKNTMYILILEADAKAHFEVYNAPFKKVSSCTHEVDCSLVHVTPDTAANLAADLESEGKNILAATNASYFMLSNKCYTPWGMQIVNGKVNIEPHIVSSSSNRGRTWFGVTKDGTPVISDISGYNNTYKGNIQNGIGGHTKLLINNNVFTAQSSEGDALVAIGYNAKGDIVIVVSDGDNDNAKVHPGATSADLAQLFMDLDMDIIAALQLDGGGSTAILVEDANGNLKRENTVNDYQNGVSRLENRKMADIIAIVAD